MKIIDLPKVSETGMHRTMKKMGVSYSQALEAKEIVKHKRRTANRIISEELARGRSVESIINGPLTDLAAENGGEHTLSEFIAIHWMDGYLKQHPEESLGWKPAKYKHGPLRVILLEKKRFDDTYEAYEDDIQWFVRLYEAKRWSVKTENWHSYLVLYNGEYTPNEMTEILNVRENPDGLSIWLDNPIRDSDDEYFLVWNGDIVYRSTDRLIPDKMPEMPLADRLGITYSEIKGGIEVFQCRRNGARAIIESLIGRGMSEDSIIYNDLMSYAGEELGALADLIAEQWMLDYLGIKEEGSAHGSTFADLVEEWRFGDAVYWKHQETIDGVTNELDVGRWDLHVEQGRCFLLMYKDSMTDDPSALGKYPLQDLGDMYGASIAKLTYLRIKNLVEAI